MRKMDTRSPDDMMLHGDENGMGRRGSSIGSDAGSGSAGGVAGAKTVTELAKRLSMDKSAWEGGLILKNSLFPTKMLLTEGDMDVVDQLMKVRRWLEDDQVVLFGMVKWSFVLANHFLGVNFICQDNERKPLCLIFSTYVFPSIFISPKPVFKTISGVHLNLFPGY